MTTGQQSRLGLKSIEDATTMRRRILVAFERAEDCGDEAERRRMLTFVIIGGGPTGVELAGAAPNWQGRRSPAIFATSTRAPRASF
jgi:NADH dehydrogenase FAD-containing subunit